MQIILVHIFSINYLFKWLLKPGKQSLDRISLDIFTWSNFSIKRLKISQLIKLFDQLIKKNWRILAVDRIFFKALNNIENLIMIVLKNTTLSDRGSVDRISLDIFTWSNFSVKRLNLRHLTELFDQLPEKNLRILAVDQNFY